MKFKKTRIAFSAICGILCLLLIALWVASYSTGISAHRRTPFPMLVCSQSGVLQFAKLPSGQFPYFQQSWDWTFIPHDRLVKMPSWECDSDGFLTYVNFPIWFAAALSGFGTIVPWIRWRFSLRTLLLATTAVAVSLWFIVWMTRR